MLNEVKFTFLDNEVKVLPLLTTINGLRNKSGRPVMVDVTVNDMNDIPKNYVSKILMPILHPTKGKIIINCKCVLEYNYD